jgi:hypothetical protein
VHVRVVRFTDVRPERAQQLLRRVQEADGPPPGVRATGIQLLFDDSQQTAVVLQLFDNLEDMREGDRVFAAMDPAETPGTRASVDMCELKLDLRASS